MRFGFLLFLALLLGGCSTKMQPTSHTANILHPYTPKQTESYPYKLQTHNPITDALYEQYKKWYGTPYEYGGVTCNGVDCSSLVQQVYYDAFGIHVPRSTKLQARTGIKISKTKLREGDLLLFKTGYNTRHSGIYIEKGNFLHASSKHGVIISNIHNPYWKHTYWQSRRVLNY